MFQTVPLSIIRSFSLYSILILLASCKQTYVTYNIAVYTVKIPEDGHRNCPKHVYFYVCFWRDSPQAARASSFTRFLDHTQRRTTVGRTPLDE